jgi:NADH-quinone oxidoreductase subunit N
MAGYIRDDKRNNESALKYFLLGSFATAFMLYGVAWIYGLTGSTNLDAVRRAILGGAQDQSGSMLIIATILIFVGFAFKISAAPFHIWAPDVYQGAPAPVAGFLSAGPKAAAFAMLIRVACSAFYPLSDQWEPLFWATALATMIIGNFAALRQSNIKRMLAYSSIAHAGYILVAVTAQSEIGIAAVMFYLAAYTLMTMGVFAAVTLVASKGERYVEIEDFAGLMQRQPLVAGALTIFLFSLIGIPLTGGFFAKFYVFKAALDSNLTWLTVLGLLNSAVAAFYYLRVLVVMFMKPAPAGAETMAVPGIAIKVTLLVSAIGSVYLGVYPSAVLDFAGKAAQLIR